MKAATEVLSYTSTEPQRKYTNLFTNSKEEGGTKRLAAIQTLEYHQWHWETLFSQYKKTGKATGYRTMATQIFFLA